MKKLIPLIAVILFLSSCNLTYDFKTEEEKNFVGTWSNPNAKIVISPDGKFSYKLEEPGKTVTMNSNIERIEEDKLVINMFVTESEFKIDQAPFLNEKGQWEMKIDGRTYFHQNY